jgi:hypothetical protein
MICAEPIAHVRVLNRSKILTFVIVRISLHVRTSCSKVAAITPKKGCSTLAAPPASGIACKARARKVAR